MIPLPETSYSLASESDGYSPDRIWREEGYTAEQMHAYAAAAVAAERERWIEAVLGELDGNGQAKAIVAYATKGAA